jgi:uncharacterized damage-inducible protein DinB
MTELARLPDVRVDERDMLVQFLDFYRSILIRKAEGLDEDQVRIRIGASPLDLLGLVRHMAQVERWWFPVAFAGSDEPGIWDDDPADDDRDWRHTPADTIGQALTALRREIDRARAVVDAAPSLDDVTAIDVGPPDNPDRYGRRSLRWVLVHMIEEYARHCGHADMLRETADGAVGD